MNLAAVTTSTLDLSPAIKNIELSLVIPMFNEEEIIPFLKTELEIFFSSFPNEFEIIFVNDGSTDATPKLLSQWALENKHIQLVNLSTNEGHQKALLHGIQNAKGKWVLTMDADLQDPLELLSTLLSKGKEGFDVVHAQRITREGESIIRKASTWLFYRIAKGVFQKSLLLDVGDFRLMSNTALKTYFSQVQNPSILRKEIPRLPLNQAVVGYQRKPRLKGKSKFTLYKLLKFALEILKK